ncbi:LysR family transcriptional regulator [Vineibacter terrae]|uniref:LysR family transcriptional regulator n=1 Tax=Vineibacter terrae TaxID=2586908 RepID=A0A5C8PWP3_9HYPH|nr:LysR substrate-binding domain-containing protein [Vineibacter terrae]TXL82290.1 LysR family transcriptional regulator [Vineibacter terrae]
MKSAHLSSDHLSAAHAIPPLSALLAFERAATHLSFRRAAQELAITPSAVSHQIRGLEERFGVRLFARAGRSVRLTPDGERYLRAAAAGLSLLDEAGRDLHRRGRGGPRELRVSSLPFFTSAVLIPALATFARRHPDLTLHIEATHQYADFDSAGVDVAIRYGRERAAGLRLEPLANVYSQPVCAPRLARAGLKTPADLSRHVLIHVAQQPQSWPAWLKEMNLPSLEPRGHLWFDAVPAALDAAEQGLGVALAMHPLIRGRSGFGTRLVMPFEGRGQRTSTLYFVCRPEQAADRRISAFRRWLIEAVRQASGG